MTFSYGFLQLISKPTRIQNFSASTIDHILTNNLTIDCTTEILCNSLSDHFPLFFNIPCSGKASFTPPNVMTRNFSLANINTFKANLSNLGWQNVTNCDNAQTAFDNFSETFSDLFELHFPVTSKNINKRYHKIEPWMSSGILTSRKTKMSLNLTAIKKPTESNLTKFKKYRNIYNTVIRNAKQHYYNRKLNDYKDNLHKTWQLLFNIIRRVQKKKMSNFLF